MWRAFKPLRFGLGLVALSDGAVITDITVLFREAMRESEAQGRWIGVCPVLGGGVPVGRR